MGTSSGGPRRRGRIPGHPHARFSARRVHGKSCSFHLCAKVAQQLALAHHLQAAIDRGAIADRADVARKLGLTRARVTQLLDLLLLAPDLQAAVLAMEAVDGAEPMAERTLRAVAHAGTWMEQRAAWAGVGSAP